MEFKEGHYYILTEKVHHDIKTIPFIIRILNEETIRGRKVNIRTIKGKFDWSDQEDRAFWIGSAMSEWPWKDLGNKKPSSKIIKILYGNK